MFVTFCSLPTCRPVAWRLPCSLLYDTVVNVTRYCTIVRCMQGIASRRVLCASPGVSIKYKILSILLWGSGFEVTQRYLNFGADLIPARGDALLCWDLDDGGEDHAAMLDRISQVRSTYLLRCHFILKHASFYQDGLGTNIGKAHSKRRDWRCFLTADCESPADGPQPIRSRDLTHRADD
jgi:hypothetical protein